MTEIAEKIFKTDDLIRGEPFYLEKKKSIEKLREIFTQNLNTGEFGTRRDEDFWVRKGYYVTPIIFEDYHLAEAWEEKKIFVKWFLEKYPQYNVPYDPQKRDRKEKIEFASPHPTKKPYIWVKPMRIARERDLLFGLSGEQIVTVENWRERIKEAKSKEEIEDIQGLLGGEWFFDEFATRVRSYIIIFVDNMQDLTQEMRRKFFEKRWFEKSLVRLEHKIEGKRDECWGGQAQINEISRQIGMQRAYLAARELLAPALRKVYEKAQMSWNEKLRVNREAGWKTWQTLQSISKPEKPTLVSAPPTPSQPDPNDSGYDSDLLDPVVEEAAQKQLNEIKNKLKETSEKIKKSDSNPDNTPFSPKDKEKIKETIRQLEQQAQELEGKDNGISSTILAELKGQIESLKKQLEEFKKSLKEILKTAQDYARRLFNWFKEQKVKKITFQDQEQVLVEYENGENKIISGDYGAEDELLAQFEEYCQQSEQKSLSYHELSQIIGSAPLSTSNEKGHWEKYKYFYFAGIIGLLVIGGLMFYQWIRKRIN